MREGKMIKNVKKAPKAPRPKIPPTGQKPVEKRGVLCPKRYIAINVSRIPTVNA